MKSSDRQLSSLSQISLFIRISAFLIVLVLLMILVLSLFIIKRQKDILYQEKMKAGEITLNHIVNSAIIPLVGDDTLSLNTLVKETTHLNGHIYAIIIDDKEMIRAHTDPTKIGGAFNESENTKKMTKDENMAQATYTIFPGTRVMDLSRPVSFMNKTIGSVHLGLSLDYINREIKKETFSLVYNILFLSLFMIVIMIVIAFFLSKRLSRQISESILPSQRNPLNPFLPKITRNQVTVIFAGIKGFRAYADTRAPEEVLEDLNEYFAIATSSILDFGGYIDKFAGDAVIGVFGGSPLQTDHTERAVRSAVAMQKSLETANKKGNPLLCKVGIGISSGVVLSGQIGSRIKKEYTFIGESFKAAYSLNLMAGPGEIVISKDVYQLIENFVSAEPLPPLEMTQKTEPWENFRLDRITESKKYG
jgi:adenylate cyclase